MGIFHSRMGISAGRPGIPIPFPFESLSEWEILNRLESGEWELGVNSHSLNGNFPFSEWEFPIHTFHSIENFPFNRLNGTDGGGL